MLEKGDICYFKAKTKLIERAVIASLKNSCIYVKFITYRVKKGAQENLCVGHFLLVLLSRIVSSKHQKKYSFCGKTTAIIVFLEFL
jgi:hypothetical protein